MSVKKSRQLQFTFEDAKGKLRVVHVQLVHDREGDRDSVQVIATSDGVPLHAVAHVVPASSTKARAKARL